MDPAQVTDNQPQLLQIFFAQRSIKSNFEDRARLRARPTSGTFHRPSYQ
jgi:hypothetical protein